MSLPHRPVDDTGTMKLHRVLRACVYVVCVCVCVCVCVSVCVCVCVSVCVSVCV